MSKFKKESKSLITNSKCLTEGVDVPAVDMVAIFSNKKSKIDIIQAIGRALRKHPGKQCGYIMVPVFVDTAAGETYEEALAKPESQVIFELLLALEQHDDLLCETISKCKFNEGYSGRKPLALLDRFFETSTRQHLTSNLFQKALAVTIIDKLGSNWHKMVGCLVKFKKKYGNCLVPQLFKEDPSLAYWVSTVRQLKKRDKLTEEKTKELDMLGFVWEPHETVWQQRIADLKEFKEKYGHCKITTKTKCSQDLISWARNTRVARKTGKLSVVKIKELNNFGWVWEPVNERWQSRVEQLKEFYKEFGHCLVPRKYENDPTLGSWVTTVRTLKRENKLTKEKIKELASLGFVWDSLDSVWQQRIAELKEFKKQYDHCLVLKCYKNKQLVNWIGTVRKAQRNGQLSKEKIKELDSLGFVWDSLDSVWQQRIAELKEFKKQYGHCLVPRVFKNSQVLGVWIGTVRKAKKKGRLSKEKIKELDSLGFEWDPLGSIWQQRIAELKKFKKQYGHCLVFKCYKNKQLVNWVVAVRKLKKEAKLSKEKIKELDMLRFIWDPLDSVWQQRIAELKEFKKKYGCCLIPCKYKKNQDLANWATMIRCNRKQGKLTKTRIRELNKIGFVWDNRK